MMLPGERRLDNSQEILCRRCHQMADHCRGIACNRVDDNIPVACVAPWCKAWASPAIANAKPIRSRRKCGLSFGATFIPVGKSSPLP